MLSKKMPIRIQAEIRSESYNAENNTITVTFTTGKKGLRELWDGTKFFERLAVTPEAVRLTRLNLGAPFLNSHDISLDSILGVTENARIDNGVGIVDIRLSTRAEVQGIIQDIKAGIIRNISVGYKRYAYTESMEPGDEYPTRLFTDWEPVEVSAVPVPFDEFSQTRQLGQDDDYLSTQKTGDNQMAPKDNVNATEPVEPTTATAVVTDGVRSNTQDVEPKRIDTAEAVRAERQRVKEIREAVRSAKLQDGFADNLIDNGSSIDEARKLIIEEFAKSDVPVRSATGIQITQDETVVRREALENAVMHRVLPDVELKGKAVDYRGISLPNLAADCLVNRGEISNGQALRLSPAELVSRALTSSDYPIVLSNVMSKSLRALYDAVPQTFKAWTRATSVNDFKENTSIQFGGNISLEEVNEAGEYKRGKLAEAKETFKLKTYGKVVGLTRQALINDDLNAFSRLARLIANAAANLESDTVYGILLNNPKTADGITLFHASHANLASPATALSATSLNDAEIAIKRQTGLDGEKLNLAPEFLLVPPELKYSALQLLAPVNAQQTSNVNIFANAYSLVVEQRLTAAKTFFLAACPNAIDTIIYAYLSGQEGLYTETKYGWEIDGVETKARLDFGAKALDWRGLYKNVGA